MQDQAQIALVTGATSGLGRAIAEKLANDGLLVIVHGRDVDRGAEVVRGIEARGGRARFVRADLADPTSIERLVTEIAAIGPIDVLVNNAGYAWYGPTAKLDAAGFDALFATNVRATYLMVAAFAPAMATESPTQPAYVALEPFRPDQPGQPAVVALPVPHPYSQYGRITNWSIEDSLPDAVAAFVKWLVDDSGWTVTEP